MILLALACTDEPTGDSAHSDVPWVPDPVVLEVIQDLDGVEYGGSFPGLALGDLDGDGWLDLVVVVPFEQGTIYLNDGTGHLVAGETIPDGTSVALGDLDGDGDLDIVLGRDGQDTVLYNEGVWVQSALPDSAGMTFTVALFDADGDADLDAAFARYPTNFTPDDIVDGSLVGPGNQLFENVDGALVDVTERLPEAARDDVTFLMKPFDRDADGDLDLLLCNDFGPWLEPSVVLENDGGVFTRTPDELSSYAMGASISDVDGDGSPDLYVTDIGGPDLMLSGWIEAAASYGVAVPAGDRLTSWGTAFVDLDLDGDDDLVTVFGPLEAGGADLSGLGIDDPDPAEQADLVLIRDQDTFSEVVTGFEDLGANRTLVVGDLDRDGAPELIVGGMGTLKVWSVTSAVGNAATVTGPPGTRVQWGDQTRWIEPATTWGQHAPEVVLGLAGADEVEVTLTWPDGSQETATLAAGDRI